MHTYISLDTETSGVDFSSSQVIQCGAIFLDENMQPSVRKSWNVNYIQEKFTWSEESAEIHKISKDDAMVHGVSPKVFLKELENEIIKHCGLNEKEVHIIAVNAHFDWLMLERLWETYRGGEKFPISRRVIDLTSISLAVIGDAGMSTMLEVLGIPVDKAKQHNAMYDAELHLKIFHSLSTVAQQDGIALH